MCEEGDIIIINEFIGEDGKLQSKHPFVVINTRNGNIKGVDYDIIACPMSSIKNYQHRLKQLSYHVNLEVKPYEVIASIKNTKSGFIKCNKLNYFDKNKTDYYVFGKINYNCLQRLKIIISSISNNKKIMSHNIYNI